MHDEDEYLTWPIYDEGCERCGAEESEIHTCPFRVTLYPGTFVAEKTCTCCAQCTQQCEDDI